MYRAGGAHEEGNPRMAEGPGGSGRVEYTAKPCLRTNPARGAACRSDRGALHQGEPPRARAVPAGNAPNRSKLNGPPRQRPANTRRKDLMDAPQEQYYQSKPTE